MARLRVRHEHWHRLESLRRESLGIEFGLAAGRFAPAIATEGEIRFSLGRELQADVAAPLQLFACDALHPWMVAGQRLVDQIVLRVAEAGFLESHALAKLTEQPDVRPRLADRLDRLLRHLREMMAVGALHVLVFEERGRWKQDVRIVRRVCEELLMHHGEQVVAAHTAQDGVLVGSDRRGVAVVDEERLHWRVPQVVQRRSQLRHIHGARIAAERAGEHQFGHSKGVAVERERSRSGELQAAAAMHPGAGDAGKHGDSPRRRPTVLRTLNTVVDTDQSGCGPCIFAREFHHVLSCDAGRSADAFRRVVRKNLLQLRETVGVFRDVLRVVQALVHDHVHQAKRERAIRSRTDRDVPVGQLRGAGRIRVDHDEPSSVAPGLLDERPQMHVVAMHIRSPRQDEFGVAEVFGVRAQLDAIDREHRSLARGRADGAIELRRSEPMEKSSVHRPEAKLADGARVGIWKDALRPVLTTDGLQPGGDRVERLVPTNAMERTRFLPLPDRPFDDAGAAAHRVEQPVRRVDAVKIFRDLAAKKAARDGMRRVAPHPGGASARCVHRHQHRAGVRAVVGADRVDHLRVALQGGHTFDYKIYPHRRLQLRGPADASPSRRNP